MTEEKKDKEVKKKKNIFIRIFTVSSAMFFWTYALLKLFVFDIDIYLINTWFSNYSWLVEFKFLIILGLLSILWIFTKNSKIFSFLVYIILFPFILFLWKIPMLIVKSKSWIAAFTYISMAIAFFRSLKANTIGLALFIIPTILLWRCSNRVVLWASVFLILFFILFIFSRAIYFAFTPSLLFRMQSKVVDMFWSKIKSYCMPDKEIKDIELHKMDDKQIAKWSNCLQNAVIFNRTCYFLTTKLQNFQKSKINVAFYLANFFFLVLLTIFAFALLNFAFYKIDPNSFFTPFSPRFYHFIYYSANTLFTNGIPDFYALSSITRGISTVEVVIAFVLLGILFFLITTIVTDRHNEDIEFAIKSMRKQGEHLDELIKEHYKLTIDEAIQELQRLKASLLTIITYLSSNINYLE